MENTNFEVNHLRISFSDHNLAPIIEIGKEDDTMWGRPRWQINQKLLTPENK